MTDRPTIIPPGIDAPAIHRETNPEQAQAPYGVGIQEHALSPVAVVDAMVPQVEPHPPKARRPKPDTGAASLAFWRALSDAARAKYGR
jgi:hypothetical protein